MTDETQEKVTTFEYEGGTYEVLHDSIRRRLTAARVQDLTIGKTTDADALRYFRMFHTLLSTVQHVEGAHSLPLVDIDPMAAGDAAIIEAWQQFLDFDPFGWENDFWNAWWNANPSVNQWAATPAAYAELLETEEKKSAQTD